MIGMVVASFMHDQRTPLDVGKRLQAGSQDRCAGVPVIIHVKRRQIAEMPVSPRKAMLARFLGIEMSPGRAGGDRFAAFFSRVAVRVLVNVESVKTRFEAL